MREKGNSVKPLSCEPKVFVDGNCEWFFKAVFAEGKEFEPETFDFCEEELESVFK